MNSDQIKGKATELGGKLKQGAGELTGSDKLANEGVADQAKGNVQQTWGNVKDAAHESASTHAADTQTNTSATRETVSDHIRNASDKVNEKIDDFKDRERMRRPA
jgi:uncharacterized protein YjbJ (UPF0337 family)